MKKQTMVIILLVVVAVMLLAVLIVGCILLIGPHECSFGKWEIIKQATCAEEGQRQRSCFCGEKQVESIETLEHSYAVLDDALEPTCVESGLTSTTHCSACGTVLVGQQIVPALGHDFSEDWTVDVEATLTSVGSRSHYCTRCDEKTSITEIPMLPYSDGLEYVLNFDGASYSVKSIGIFEGSDLNIAPVYNGLPVTKISVDAFKDCANLTSVKMPNSILTIGERAFNGCNSLQNITISNSVTSVGDYAFAYCYSLTNITIPNSTSNIGWGIFYGCNRLQSISMSWAGLEYDYLYTLFGGNSFDNNIPNSLSTVIITGGTAIGTNAFKDCTTLRKVYIHSSITYIGTNAFRGCNNLTIFSSRSSKPSGWASGWNWDNCPVEWDYVMESDEGLEYTLNSDGRSYSITGIGNFKGSNLTIPAGYNFLPVTEISSNAFSGCTNLTSIIVPDSVTTIGKEAFLNCNNLESITIPFVGETKDGTTNTNFSYIFGYLYNIPESLETVIITGGTTIGEKAFSNCSSLKNITIPSSITSIGTWAFEYCKGLTGVYITDLTAWCNISFDNYAANPLNYAKNLYLNNELVTELVIPNNITSIGKAAFVGCSSLTSITIPNSVTSIGEEAFWYCDNLESITVPSLDNISLGYLLGSLDRLESLKTVIVTGGTTISESAFWYCTCLTSITIPNSVTSIGEEAFVGCSSLTSITIPSSVTSIGKDAFRDCASLTSITIPNSVTSIGSSVFRGCTSLESISIPFAGGTNNGVVVNPSRIVGDVRTSLKTVIITGGTEINDHAFKGWSSLESITISDSVTSIGLSAFEDCSSLKNVYYTGTEEQWNRISIDSWNSPLTRATIHYNYTGEEK